MCCRIGKGARLFRKRGDHPGRAVRQEQGGAPAARVPRAFGQAGSAVRRADRNPAVRPGRAQVHRGRVVLPPDHRSDAHRAVRVRHLHQLLADSATSADHHQQVQNMPLSAVSCESVQHVHNMYIQANEFRVIFFSSRHLGSIGKLPFACRNVLSTFFFLLAL